MLTRRSFLVGAGLGAGVAMTGAVTVADRVASARGIDLDATARRLLGLGPTLRSETFASAYRRTDVNWVVALPHDVDPAGLPMVLALHAKDGDAKGVFGWLHVEDVLDEHVRSGGKPFAIVAADGGADSFWHPRSDGTDALRMLTAEVLPRAGALGLRTDRIGVMGWSMGGLGTLNLARESSRGRLGDTEVVTAVATAPALWTSASDAMDGAFDDDAQFARWGDLVADPGVASSVALRVDCGSSDPLAPTTRAYRAAVDPTPAGGFVPGAHDGPTWRSLLADQVAFLAQHLPAA